MALDVSSAEQGIVSQTCGQHTALLYSTELAGKACEQECGHVSCVGATALDRVASYTACMSIASSVILGALHTLSMSPRPVCKCTANADACAVLQSGR